MISRAVAFFLIGLIGFTLYWWTKTHWVSVPIVMIVVVCAIASILPPRYQYRSSILSRGFALGIFVLGMFLMYSRFSFIVENGGMEGPDGVGSPLAFLIGFAFEQLFFTLPSFYIMWAYSKKRVERWQLVV